MLSSVPFFTVSAWNRENSLANIDVSGEIAENREGIGTSPHQKYVESFVRSCAFR
tara:strand:+ start:9649 stop:9813 length:165 start_codon:yes stop_codon:yes gene_type:complete